MLFSHSVFKNIVQKWSDFFKQVFYGLNWTTDVLLPVNQNSNRTIIVGVDFLKVHHFLFLALIEIDLWQVYDVSFFKNRQDLQRVFARQQNKLKKRHSSVPVMACTVQFLRHGTQNVLLKSRVLVGNQFREFCYSYY